MATAIDKPPMLSPQQIAERMNVDYHTVLYWIRDKRLRATKYGKLYRVELEDFEEFLRTGDQNVNTRRTQTDS